MPASRYRKIFDSISYGGGISAAAFVANTMSAIYWSKVEFIVNLKIAKSLGLAVPNSVLDRANGVIR